MDQHAVAGIRSHLAVAAHPYTFEVPFPSFRNFGYYAPSTQIADFRNNSESLRLDQMLQFWISGGYGDVPASGLAKLDGLPLFFTEVNCDEIYQPA